MTDMRDILFKSLANLTFEAVLTIEREGILAGVEEARHKIAEMGLQGVFYKKDGDSVYPADLVAKFKGDAKQIAALEEVLAGALSKASGIATAAYQAVASSEGRVEIVCGSWKKMPLQIKDLVRNAISVGGARIRICPQPMVYLDKNILRMMGSVTKALQATEVFEEYIKIVQIKGYLGSVEKEVEEAVLGGATILMVDTGVLSDLERCYAVVTKMGVRDSVKLAFAGDVKLENVASLSKRPDIDLLCIGKAIIDAPLLDMKLDVIKTV